MALYEYVNIETGELLTISEMLDQWHKIYKNSHSSFFSIFERLEQPIIYRR